MSTSPVPVILLVFANDEENSLKYLTEELNAIQDLLLQASDGQTHFQVVTFFQADIRRIWKYLGENSNTIWAIHFAGHANSEEWILASGPANTDGLSKKLAKQKKLKFVFLNGCSTAPQVKQLLREKIPTVIATNSPIGDRNAFEFAEIFYHSLVHEASIKDAFESAKDYLPTIGNKTIVEFRSLYFDEIEQSPSFDTWGLYHLKDEPKILEVRLPKKQWETKKSSHHYEPNDNLQIQIVNLFASNNFLKSEIERKTRANINSFLIDQFPSPIGEQLRRLFMPPIEEYEISFKSHQINFSRLEQLIYTYEVIIKFITFIHISEFWKLLITGKVSSIRENTKQQIKNFLKLNEQSKKRFSYFMFLKEIRKGLKAKEDSFFIHELKILDTSFEKNLNLQSSCAYFYFLQKRLDQITNNENLEFDISEQCFKAEKNLAIIFKYSWYLAKYVLTNIGQVKVEKQRYRMQKANYHHSISYLKEVVNSNYKNKQQVAYKDFFFENYSVSLQKKEDIQNNRVDYLNLSPFIIDANAFNDKADETNIYFLNHYDEESNVWVYKQVERPNGGTLTVPKLLEQDKESDEDILRRKFSHILPQKQISPQEKLGKYFEAQLNEFINSL